MSANVIRTDIIRIADFRLKGPTSRILAEEIRVQSEAGFRTHLVQATSKRIAKVAPWPPHVRASLAWPNVALASSHAKIDARLIIITSPEILVDCPERFEHIRGERVLLVATSMVKDLNGEARYDPKTVERTAKYLFGIDPEWAPKSAVVWEELSTYGLGCERFPEFWSETVQFETSNVPRNSLSGERRTIGRHAKSARETWPSDKRQVALAYPSRSDLCVHVMAEEGLLKGILDVPKDWVITSPKAEKPMTYLEQIDFWVYFHAEEFLEVEYRPIIEALASGAVVILPHYLERVFGNAALYCTPAEVRELVATMSNDIEAFLAQSRQGQRYAAASGPAGYIDRLEKAGLVSGKSTVSRTAEGKTTRRAKKRLLFVTSNGAGMGHLTRLLAVATRLPREAQPVFASLSLGVHVVSKYGIPYEYIPSKDASRAPVKEWNDYSLERFTHLLRDVRPDVMVFDGVWPYRGLREAAKRSGVRRAWMRRGMWKADTSERPLSWAAEFNDIIEPGEFAGSYDSGPTASRQEMNIAKVDPVTLLSNEELLSKEQARRELGYGAEDKVALVTLGAGNINDIGALQTRVLDWFKKYEPNWRVVVTKPPIAAEGSQLGVDTLQVYPLARYTNAFDVAVSAVGYNAFHEWMVGCLPTLWVPNTFTRTDDQLARARWAEDNGFGLYLREESTDEVARALSELTQDHRRNEMIERLNTLDKTNGAVAAAGILWEKC